MRGRRERWRACPAAPRPARWHRPCSTPQPAATSAALPATGTGINPWWRYEEQNVPGGGHVMVNVGTGNMLLQADDMNVPHKGIALAFRRTYNAQSLHDTNGDDATSPYGSFPAMYGNGWTDTFDAHLTRSADRTVSSSVYDIDGARYDYAHVPGDQTLCDAATAGSARDPDIRRCLRLLVDQEDRGRRITFTAPTLQRACPSIGSRRRLCRPALPNHRAQPEHGADLLLFVAQRRRQRDREDQLKSTSPTESGLRASLRFGLVNGLLAA